MGDHLGVHALGQVIDPIRIQGREPVDGFPPLILCDDPHRGGENGSRVLAASLDDWVIPTRVGNNRLRRRRLGHPHRGGENGEGIHPPDFGTRLIPTVVGKIVGVVAGEGHGFDGSTPLPGSGLSSSRKVWWGAGFRGPYPDGPQTPTGPETPAAALAGARGNGAGSGG